MWVEEGGEKSLLSVHPCISPCHSKDENVGCWGLYYRGDFRIGGEKPLAPRTLNPVGHFSRIRVLCLGPVSSTNPESWGFASV